MYEPLVSIVTPLYNHERYIGRCIDSLRKQTYTKWELVVVDDGSTDGSANVVKQYQDSRIRYVHQANKGVKRLAETMNSGVRLTQGELVTMMASDDTWPADRIARQVPVFEDANVVLCYGYGTLIDENDRVIGMGLDPAKHVTHLDNKPVGSILHEMLVVNWIPQYTVLIRRSALDAIGLYLQPEGLFAEDYPTHLALAMKGEFRYIGGPLGNYRMHVDQMTRNHRLIMAQTDVPYLKDFYRKLDPVMKERANWTEEALFRELDQQVAEAYFQEGRRNLIVGEWKNARHHFWGAINRGRPAIKVKSALGLCLGALHKDMEKVARLTGKGALK